MTAVSSVTGNEIIFFHERMVNMKKALSVFLIFGILLSVFPMTVVNADDTLQDRTNINMDYKYDKTLSQVQREARDGQIRIMSDKDYVSK